MAAAKRYLNSRRSGKILLFLWQNRLASTKIKKTAGFYPPVF